MWNVEEFGFQDDFQFPELNIKSITKPNVNVEYVEKIPATKLLELKTSLLTYREENISSVYETFLRADFEKQRAE